MTYRDGAELRLKDLTDAEKLAFGGLLRLLVRLDGVLSPEESAALGALGLKVGGGPDLWALLNRAAIELTDPDAVRAMAKGVQRPQVRAWMYASLRDIAAADGINLSEWDLLEWLEKNWGLVGV